MTRVIAVAGGKGGTGKTLVASSIALSLTRRGFRTLLVDVDVENPCTPVLVGGVKWTAEGYVYMFKPIVDLDKCVRCGLCADACHEHAIVVMAEGPVVSYDVCTGCGACSLVCPISAIEEGRRLLGLVKYGSSRHGLDLIVGELVPGERRVIDLALEVIERAKTISERYEYVVVDSPPGTGAVIHAVARWCDVMLAVTEPTTLGVNDLKRFLGLVKPLVRGEIILVVNKYGLPGGVELPHLDLCRAHIPYDPAVPKALSLGLNPASYDPGSPASKALEELADMLIML